MQGISFLFGAFRLAILSGFHGKILRSVSQKLQIKKGFRFGFIGFSFFFFRLAWRLEAVQDQASYGPSWFFFFLKAA